MPEYTSLGGHPCVHAHNPKTGTNFRCVRCGATEAFDISSCVPGMTVHLPPLDTGPGGSRRHWLAKGYNVVVGTSDPVGGHPLFRACLSCYDPATDPAVHHPAAPEPGYTNPAVTAAPGTAVLLGGAWTTVLWTLDWPPETHQGYTPGISTDWWARQVVTAAGSRWFSHAPGQRYTGTEATTATLGRGISFEHDQPEPAQAVQVPPLRPGKTQHTLTTTADLLTDLRHLVIDFDPPA